MEKEENIIANVVLPKKPLTPMMHDKIKDMILKLMNCSKFIFILSNIRDASNKQRKRKNKKVLTRYHCLDRLLGTLNIAVTPVMFFLLYTTDDYLE